MKKLVNANKWWLLGAVWVYTFTFVFNHYWSKSASYDSIASSFSKRIDKQLLNFNSFCNDTGNIRRLLDFRLDSAHTYLNQTDAFYYLFEDSPDGMQLRYWSNADVVPAPDAVPYRDTAKLVTYQNGKYVLVSRKIPHSRFIALQLILIKREYFIQNSSLSSAYTGFPGLEQHIAISTTPTPYAVKANGDQTLFYLQATRSGPIILFNWPSLLVQVAATLLLMIFFYRIGMGLAQNKRLLLSFAWMASAAILLRLSVAYIDFPVNLSNTDLFNRVTRSTFFFRSLGGLLLNLLMLAWFTYFSIRTRFTWLPLLENLRPSIKKIVAIAGILLLLPVSFMLGHLVVRLVLQPNVSFDVTNSFSLGWNTLGSIVCLYFICVLHYRIMHISNEMFSRLWPQNGPIKFLILAAAGLLSLTFLISVVQGEILVLVLLWLLISLLLEDKLPQLLFYSMERPVRFVFWLIWYAFASTLLVQSQYQVKDEQNKLQLARRMAQHSDTEAESLIYQAINSKAVKELNNIPLLAEDPKFNNYLRQSIVQTFNQSMRGYTTKVYFFDSTEQPLYNTDSATFEALNTIVEEQGQTTRFNSIYFYESSFERFSYIVRQQLNQDSINGGFLFITCMPATFNTQTLAPELFEPLQSDVNNTALPLYSYAIYDHGRLLYSNHNFPFTTVLVNDKKLQSDYEIRAMYGRKTLWYNAGNQRLIIVVKSSSLFSEVITLFAYISGCFILIYLAELLLARLLTGSYRLHPVWLFTPLSIRSKIRRTVIITSLLSFVLIGIATVYLFIHRYQSANNSRLTQLVSQVEGDLQALTDINTLFPQQSRYTTKPDFTSNSSTVSLVAELLNVNINLFNINGDLTATTRPIVYERGIVSSKMNPVAYHQMVVNHQVQFIQAETIGNLVYQGVYLPVRTGDGATIGFINIPYFASQSELNQEISNFLLTLINLIAFISIIAGIVAFFITNSITSSFYTIGQKMKVISLGKTNEPIAWERNDEIGILVQQYNKMLEQLDESARRLATSEREYAWREMAKQVAHEIKNPLTPMKLNLQYLQRQIENKAPNVTELAAKMVTTLVTQIDHLSQIASDFSQLARINVTHVEKFDLHEVLQQVVRLYQMDSHIGITWHKTEGSLMIEADRTQLNRLFTNLIKNASEAVTETKAIIVLSETRELSAILLSVNDNGPGIPEELKQHLFMPNFTTKTSGTGLGLAICKDIVERAGGTIWFQSGNGEQTSFFVRLPLVEA